MHKNALFFEKLEKSKKLEKSSYANVWGSGGIAPSRLRHKGSRGRAPELGDFYHFSIKRRNFRHIWA